jgi:hypothetical protein
MISMRISREEVLMMSSRRRRPQKQKNGAANSLISITCEYSSVQPEFDRDATYTNKLSLWVKA